MALFTLHPYQQAALQSVIDGLKNKIFRQLITLPTASGKTVIMAAIAKHLKKRTLVLAHRFELIQQTVKTFKHFWPEVSIGICQGKQNDYTKQVVVGSVQSCIQPKRLEQLKQQGFEVLMIDEVHHCAADSYQKIINELGFGPNTNNLLLGVTATPERADKKQLGNTFEKVIFSRTIGELIADDYLSPVIGRKILTETTLQDVKTSMGDFEASGLSRAVNTPSRNTLVVQSYKQYAANRKAVVFCADVKHCKDIAAEFNKHGIKAEAVFGSMPAEQRKKILSDFKEGRVSVVSSCGVLTEGWDEPSVTAILMARPTKSRSLYIQSVGRGLRKHPGKTDCLVLDFTDKTHTLSNVVSLIKAIPEAKEIRDIVKRKPQEKIPAINDTIGKIRSYEWNILGGSRLIWIPINNGEFSLADDNKAEIIMRPIDGGFVANLYYPNGRVTRLIAMPLPFRECIDRCERFAREQLSVHFADLDGDVLKNQMEQAPSQNQLQYLTQSGVDVDGLNKAKASIEIRRIVAFDNQAKRHRSAKPKRRTWVRLSNSNLHNKHANHHSHF